MTMHAIWLDTPGGPLILRETAIPTLAEGEVLVKVHATAVNRADILQRQGRYNPPPGASPILGLEFAGTVEHMGDTKTTFKPGDRVMGIVSGGAYATYVAVPAAQLIPIPEHLSFEEAAAIPEAFITANESLFETAALQPNERLLLHAATSGVGTAVLQLAKLQSVSVIALARDDTKLKKIATWQPELCINYQTSDWVQVIRDHGLSEHINVVADFIGAEYIKAHLDLLAFDGRMVHLATMRGNMAEVDLRQIMRKQLRLYGFQLRLKTPAQKAWASQHFCQRWGQALTDGLIQPFIAAHFPLAQAEEAQALVKENAHVGKVILSVE